jgi:hypothetical protein
MTDLSMPKSADVRSRIEPDLKDRAAEVLAACGLNLSDAIRLFLRIAGIVAAFGTLTSNGSPLLGDNLALLLIANEGPLPQEYRDHELTGDWKGFRVPHRRRFPARLPAARGRCDQLHPRGDARGSVRVE